MRALVLAFFAALIQLPAQDVDATTAAAAAPSSTASSGVAWSFDDPVLLAEGRNEAEVSQSAKAGRELDRGAALDAALAKAKAEGKAVLWYCPRITAGLSGRQMYRPAILDGYAMLTFFTDPECVAMVNRRTVAVRMTCDAALGKRFGITGPERVEPMLAVLTPDGTVVAMKDGFRTFSTVWFESFMNAALEKAGVGPAAATQALAGDAAKRDDHARALLEDGLAASALDALGPMDAAEPAGQRTLRAAALRRTGAESKALEILAGLEDKGTSVALERARSLVRLGRFDEALAALGTVRRGRDAVEAHWLRGMAHFMLKNDVLAQHEWREAAANRTPSPFAARASACVMTGRDLTPLGPLPHGFEDPVAAHAEQPANATGTSHPVAATAARDIATRGLDHLLQLQRESGGWTDSRYAYWPTPDLTPNAWMAATALSLTALQEWRDLAPERVDAAIAAGERYLFDERKMNRGSNEEIYADAYRLLYLTRKLQRGDKSRQDSTTLARMKESAAHLQRTQTTGKVKGFWAHEYPNPFSTGAVMDILLMARDAGLPVAPSLFEDGAQALLSVRSPGGSYAYGAGRASKDSEEAMKNSMGRSPICESVLLRSGHASGSAENVAAALANFWKYQPRLDRVRRCDFHTDGELAGFFFWHTLYHVSNAVTHLRGEAASTERAKLLDYVATLQELDGSFLDSHEMGKAVGTAYGLLTLANLMNPAR